MQRLAVILLSGFWLYASPAPGATKVLLSNLDQPDLPSPAYISASIWNAAPFITGDEVALLTSATLATRYGGGQGAFWVMVYSDNNGVPGTPLQNGLLSGASRVEGRVTHYARGELRLLPNTRYWVVAASDEPDSSGQGYGWYMTLSWEYTGFPGWILPHYGAYTTDAGVSWISTENAAVPRPFFLGLTGTVSPQNIPALSVSDAGTSVGAGNLAAFAVRLSRPAPVAVSVEFKATAAWANADHFAPANGRLTFPPGETNQTISVAISGDPGTNQTFRLQLSNASNAVLGNFEAIGTITNETVLPEVLLLSGSVRESNEKYPNFLALVKLSRPSAVPVSVHFATAGLTAVPGHDFVATNGTLTLGGTSPITRWVPVRVNPNRLTEPDKTLTLELSQGSNCIVSATPGVLTIENDDGLPGKVNRFSIMVGAQPLSGIPCPVTVRALDSAGEIATNFNERVFLMAGYSNAPPQHFGFEEGDFSEWWVTPGMYQPGPYEMRQFDTTQPGVTNFAFRISPNLGGDGIQRQVFLEGGRKHYISVSFAQALDAGPNNGSSTARLLIDNSQVAAAAFGDINYGQVLRTNLVAIYNPWYSLWRFVSLSFDRQFFEARYVGAFADDLVVSPLPFKSFWSGAFTNGVWSGTVTFPAQSTDVLLFAEDLERHAGSSGPLTVLPTPNLGLGSAYSAGAGRVGESLTFSVSVTNSGETAASGVVLSNGFTPGVLVFSVTSTAGAWTNSGTNVICNLGTLAVGQRATVTILARSSDTNAMAFRSVATCEEPDPDPANNAAQLSFSVGLPGLRSASVTVRGAPGGTNLVFPVWLGGPFVQPVSVQYRTWAGINPPPGDFVQTNGTLVFEPGMTNLEVRVAVLDNGVYAGVQFCDLILENLRNAVHMNGTWFDGTILDHDPPPVLTVQDAMLMEGDAGEVEALFAVRLSGATAIPASVQFATAHGTAVASSDFFSTNGTLTFPPGTDSLPVRVRVLGNTVNEPDETFFVNLSAAVDATIARAQAVGTIVNDDLVAGRLDHFAWGPVFSPQVPHRAIPVSARALDAFGQLVTNFAGMVSLSATAGNGATNLGLAPLVAGFAGGEWSGFVSVTNTGTQVVLRADDHQEHIGLSNPFDVLPRFPLSMVLPSMAAEGDGALAGQGRVWLPLPENSDVEVGLATTNVSWVGVPESVVIPAGQTSAVFTITVLDNALLDGTRKAYISTISTQYANATASILIHDNEMASLAVSLPTQIAESSISPKAGVGTVMISGVPDASITVLLTSGNPARLQVPPSVILPPGSNTAVFNLNAPDNNRLDGGEPVTVTAAVQNWTSGLGLILVTDNEPYTLQLNAGNNAFLDEHAGTRKNGVQVILGGFAVSNVLVSLASADLTELAVPASVTVPAGTNRAYFDLIVVDDPETDGSQNAVLLASSPGFTNGTVNITVRDNDVHHFNFGAITGTRTSGVPFLISVTAADINNLPLVSYRGLILFRAVGTQGPFTIGITSAGGWSRGTWNGWLVINSGWAQTMFLEALDAAGHLGTSGSFNLVLP